MNRKSRNRKTENERLRDLYFGINKDGAQNAIESIDYTDPSVYLWATRIDRANFLHRFKLVKDQSAKAKRIYLSILLPFIVFIYMARPFLVIIFLSSLSLGVVASFLWALYIYSNTIVHLVYLTWHFIWIVLQIRLPVRAWYSNTITGRPYSSSYQNISSHILKLHWIKIFSSLYCILLFVAFISPSHVVGDFRIYHEMLLFNLDVIINTVLLGLPEAVYGNLSEISAQTWQGKLLITILKFMVVASVISAFADVAKRLRQPNSDFVGTTEEFLDYLVSYYRMQLSDVSVMKGGKFGKQAGAILPGWFFTVARSTRVGLEKNYPGAGGRDLRNIMREVSKIGLRRYSNNSHASKPLSSATPEQETNQ